MQPTQRDHQWVRDRIRESLAESPVALLAQAPWSAADAPVGLSGVSTALKERVPGDPRGPGVRLTDCGGCRDAADAARPPMGAIRIRESLAESPVALLLAQAPGPRPTPPLACWE